MSTARLLLVKRPGDEKREESSTKRMASQRRHPKEEEVEEEETKRDEGEEKIETRRRRRNEEEDDGSERRNRRMTRRDISDEIAKYEGEYFVDANVTRIREEDNPFDIVDFGRLYDNAFFFRSRISWGLLPSEKKYRPPGEYKYIKTMDYDEKRLSMLGYIPLMLFNFLNYIAYLAKIGDKIRGKTASGFGTVSDFGVNRLADYFDGLRAKSGTPEMEMKICVTAAYIFIRAYIDDKISGNSRERIYFGEYVEKTEGITIDFHQKFLVQVLYWVFNRRIGELRKPTREKLREFKKKFLIPQAHKGFSTAILWQGHMLQENVYVLTNRWKREMFDNDDLDELVRQQVTDIKRARSMMYKRCFGVAAPKEVDALLFDEQSGSFKKTVPLEKQIAFKRITAVFNDLLERYRDMMRHRPKIGLELRRMRFDKAREKSIRRFTEARDSVEAKVGTGFKPGDFGYENGCEQPEETVFFTDPGNFRRPYLRGLRNTLEQLEEAKREDEERLKEVFKLLEEQKLTD